jgi:hypothetical protein
MFLTFGYFMQNQSKKRYCPPALPNFQPHQPAKALPSQQLVSSDKAFEKPEILSPHFYTSLIDLAIKFPKAVFLEPTFRTSESIMRHGLDGIPMHVIKIEQLGV